jgi:type IV pilus assembly protein PilA
MRTLRKRLADRSEEGFTLIELMVVVLIIAILLAIAIPSFLGARGKAQDRAAQSNARNALTAEKTFYTDNQQYTDVPADMQAIEPSLSYKNVAPAQGTKEVEIAVANTTTVAVTKAIVCVTTKSANGTTFTIKDIAAGTNAGTYFSKAAAPACDDTGAVANGDWQDKW